VSGDPIGLDAGGSSLEAEASIESPRATAEPTPAPRDEPSTGAQLRAWLSIGLASWGGGASTLLLMRRAFVRQRRWLDDAAFTQDWTLSKASPGLTIVALTALLGKRIGGWRGTGLALAGLMTPAVAVTLALTAGYVLVRDVEVVREAIDGIAPTTIGMTLAMMTLFARSSVRRGWRTAVDLGLLATVAVAGYLLPSATVPILLIGLVIGWGFLGVGPTTPRGATGDAVEDA
jgi:chromate transporter